MSSGVRLTSFLSVVTVEIGTGNFNPYNFNSMFQLEMKVALNEDYRPKFRNEAEERSCPEVVQIWMRKCWQHDPSIRPAFSEVYDGLCGA